MDTLGCGFEALEYPACTKLLGPIVPGTVVPNGAKVPGHAVPARPGAGGVQHRRHDPLARLQRHLARRRMGPSVRQPRRHSRQPPTGCRATPSPPANSRSTMRDVLTGMIKAHEIQGVHRAGEQLQPRRPRPRACWSRSPPPRWSPHMLGGTRDEIINARVATPGSTASRCAPTAMRPTPARASRWAAGDATSRARAPGADGAQGRDGLSRRR